LSPPKGFIWIEARAVDQLAALRDKGERYRVVIPQRPEAEGKGDKPEASMRAAPAAAALNPVRARQGLRAYQVNGVASALASLNCASWAIFAAQMAQEIRRLASKSKRVTRAPMQL
jgi:hypothetical protein